MNTTNPAKRLLAFHGDVNIKRQYIERVRQHRLADEIINGQYWENGKGCAVGCTVHSDQHNAYEAELGIPRVLARLEDRLFEELYVFDARAAKEWPQRFLDAITPGADLNLVWPKFAAWMLLDEKVGVVTFTKREKVVEAVKIVGALFLRWAAGDKPATTEWESAKNLAAAAYADAAAAAYADAAAAYAYADAYAAYAAADAAYAAAAYAAAADRRKARQEHIARMAEKLIELLKAEKPEEVAAITE